MPQASVITTIVFRTAALRSRFAESHGTNAGTPFAWRCAVHDSTRRTYLGDAREMDQIRPFSPPAAETCGGTASQRTLGRARRGGSSPHGGTGDDRRASHSVPHSSSSAKWDHWALSQLPLPASGRPSAHEFRSVLRVSPM